MNESLEEVTCLMYGNTGIKCINEVRTLMLRKMVGDEDKLSSKSKVDFARLPPCKDSLYPHIDRVNYRVCQWKRSDIPIYEYPLQLQDDHGWNKDDGLLEPLWSRGPIIPPSMVQILEKQDDVDENDEEDGVDDNEELLAFLDEDDEND